MSSSSFLGGERAALHSSGKTAGLLGPSDSSDSGSDSLGELGAEQLDSDSDRAGTGERASVDEREGGGGGDILPDHVVRLDEDGNFTEDDTELLDDADGETDLADPDADPQDRA